MPLRYIGFIYTEAVGSVLNKSIRHSELISFDMSAYLACTHSHMHTHTALQLVPEDWLTQYYLGQVCGKLKDRQTATSLFEQAARAELM